MIVIIKGKLPGNIFTTELEMPEGTDITEALSHICLYHWKPDTYIIVKNGHMAFQDELLKDGDVLELLPILCGG